MAEETTPLTLAEVLRNYMEQAGEWTPPPAPAPAPATGTPGVPVLTIDELLARPDPAWLITGVLPEGALACVYGAPGAGKSFLVLDWALAVATGRAWAGHAVQPGPVVYIAAEGDRGLGARIEAWEAQFGDSRHAPFYVVPTATNLMDPAALDTLLAALAARAGRTLALIVVDTLARSMPGGDENSARDMGLVIAGADRLRAATGASVLLVHHTGKAGTSERGSSALRGACDMMAHVSSDDGVITLECDKMKEAAPFPVSRWTLAPRAHSCVLVPSDVALANPNRDLSPAQRAVLEALAGPVFNGSASGPDLRAATNLSDSTLYRALSALIKHGYVESDGGQGRGGTKSYQLTEAGANMV